MKNSCLNVYQSWSMSSLFRLSSWLCCHGNWYYHIIFITWESLGFSITSSSYKFISYISLGNIWIFNIWKLWLVRCDVISVERASYYGRCPKLSEVRRFPFGDSLTQLSSLITRERLDRFQRYTYCSPAFWTLFHMNQINLFSRCSSPIGQVISF